MQAEQQSELLPCPFCGGPVKLEQPLDTFDRQIGPRKWWGVVCRNTINLGGTCAIEQRPSASIDAAVARWNRRAALSHPSTPQGWKLVPVEPTKEMLKAGTTARTEHRRMHHMQSEAVYKAMLNAGPPPPEQGSKLISHSEVVSKPGAAIKVTKLHLTELGKQHLTSKSEEIK